MATRIDTEEDLLRLLRENPEFREAARRELLTEELLSLPAAHAAFVAEMRQFAAEVHEFIAATNRRLEKIDSWRDGVDQRFDGVDQRFDGVDQRFDGIDQRFDGIDQRLDGMDQRFDGIDQRLDGMDQRFDGIDQRLDGMDQRFDGMDQRFDGVDQKFDGVDQRFDSLERDVKAIHGITRRQQTDFQNFRGNFAESAARKQAGFIAGEVGKFVGKRLLPNRRLTPNDLMAMAAAANDLSHISDNRLLSFYSADVVIEMHDRLHPAEVCYVAIEASYTCDPSDIARAIDHATLLREFTRKDAYPAVAGVRINEAARDSVNGGGEEPVLWYELEEEALDI